MELLLGGALIGVIVGAIVYFVLQRSTRRELDEVSLLVSGVQGEERLRTLEASVGARLAEIGRIVNEIDRARGESIAQLSGVVSMSQRSIDDLRATTGRLAETLSSNQARGQWGERMADDILRAAGFVEGRNYLRNRQMAGSSGRPDFTFLLPDDRTLNMDVKFPIASYVRYIEALDDTSSAEAERQFLDDVRSTVRAVSTRDYIDAENHTLDFMIVFIPNEHIYAFIHQRDPQLADEALARGVVLCSPLTLFALLSVIRQAADAFALAGAADDVLRAMGAFSQQWGKYQEAVAAVGRRIEALDRAFEQLTGTRTRMLQRRLDEVERVRTERHLELPPGFDDEDESDAQAELDESDLDGR